MSAERVELPEFCPSCGEPTEMQGAALHSGATILVVVCRRCELAIGAEESHDE